MKRLFINHEVKEFDKWKPLFDADSKRHADSGLNLIGVFRQDGNTNNVLVVFEGDDTAKMKTMLSNPDIAQKMKEAGVLNSPKAFIGEKL